MRILLLTHAFNGLSQRLFVDLREAGHQVSVEFDIKDSVTIEAVAAFKPDLVIAPFLKRAVPAQVFEAVPTLIVHPGPPGDQGPSALDWAVQTGAPDWGVTVLQAEAELDGGPVWASRTFAMRPGTKGSLYRNEVTEAAAEAVMEAMTKMAAGEAPTRVPGNPHKAMTQADRAIDWATMDAATIVRHIQAADGFPGVKAEIAGETVFLFDATADEAAKGAPGQLLATCRGAVLVAAKAGGVWIGRVRRPDPLGRSLKLPTVQVLGEAAHGLPEVESPLRRDCWVERADGVAYVHFPFHNGAMATDHCERLRAAFDEAKQGPERVIVLMGGPDFWSNGMHLNMIEAADSPAEESWRNINAIDDVVHDLITADDRLVVAAIQGNGGAGGVFMALAADLVWARSGVILNPHYKGMGNLFGSEYWTYLLPRRAGADNAQRVTQARLPIGTPEAMRLKLVDEAFGRLPDDFAADVRTKAKALAAAPDLDQRIAEKARRLAADQAGKPLSAYREEELARMRFNFYGFDPSYHVARYNFVFRVPKSHTPLVIAAHRRRGAIAGQDAAQ